MLATLNFERPNPSNPSNCWNANPLIHRYLEPLDGLIAYAAPICMSRAHARARETFMCINPSNPSILDLGLEITYKTKGITRSRQLGRPAQNPSATYPTIHPAPKRGRQ
jgi:hypothetical protein